MSEPTEMPEDDSVIEELHNFVPELGHIEDPETGMTVVCMDDWATIGFIPSAADVTRQEALEGKTYDGPVRPLTEAEILQERIEALNEVVEQMLLDQLMRDMGMDGGDFFLGLSGLSD